MTQDTSLSELVLGYCRQVGALVEPPAYGVYETLLPDEVAARWGVAPFQRFVFDSENHHAGATFLHYGHAFVETIVGELRWQSANGQFFINNARPEKSGFYAAIEKTFSLPNAKIFPIPAAKEQARLHHYARFNFKVSLIADEKRELILPLWMDLQNGYPVQGADIERFGILDPDNSYVQTPPAPVSWSEGHPLSPNILAALLERARQSVAGELGETLSHLQKRLARFLELDRARLTDYYADLLKDAERRLHKSDEERRPALESKIAAIVAERESKLADVEQKYHLRVQLELVSLAVIALPKLDLTVEIRKRAATIKRIVSWNPLLHIVDPLACDVCNHAGTALHLCDNGHLAHADCLAPQCVECKRAFCKKCAHEVTTCAVCARPICVYSLTRCAECKRVTCSEHMGECHALNGEPRKIVSVPTGGYAEKAEVTESTSRAKEEASPKAESTLKAKKLLKQETPKAKPSFSKISAPPKPLADYVEVYADPSEGTITAYMIHRKRELAARLWRMSEEGILVNCQCEKMMKCEADGIVFRPSEDVERQMNYLLGLFREEYHLPDNKTRYFQIRVGKPFDEKKLKVPASWKNEVTLARAREGFERLRKKNG